MNLLLRCKKIVLVILVIAIVDVVSSQTFTPNVHYYGRNNYIEYIAGNAPFIISAPHGGSLVPAEIPDRTVGTTTKDSYTEELARDIQTAYFARTGKYPHVIINRLHRIKLDANREIVEAAAGNQYAIQAWNEFQTFIDSAKAQVTRSYGKGFYIDIHGHGHSIQRLELGYILSSSQLELSDNTLNSNIGYRNISSIRTMAANAGIPFADLLRGESSLGTFFEYHGYPAVPSSVQPDPGGNTYFNGGYNTDRHGSADGGVISGLQIESNYDGVRDTDANRKAYAKVIVEIVDNYLNLHLFKTVTAVRPNIKINEVLFDIPADDAQTTEIEGDANGDGIRSIRGDEFVEIVNNEAVDVDISGYQLLERELTPLFTFPSNIILKPNEIAVVFGGVAPNGFGPQFPASLKLFASNPGKADSGFYFSASKTNLLSTNDNIILYDPKINYVADELCWGTSSPKTKNGKKLIAPNTVNSDSISGAIQQSVTRSPIGTGLWTKHTSVSSKQYSPGNLSSAGVARYGNSLPANFILHQNYPNPFNPTTTITFSISSEQFVSLIVFNVLGQRTAVLLHEKKEPGTYSVQCDASAFTSGLYFYQLRSNGFIQTKKMTVLE